MTAAKTALRDQMLAARSRLRLAEIGDAARSIAERVSDLPEVRRAATVAAYVSIGTEPGTGALIESLHRSGRRVLLPVLLPDNDLDWAAYDGEQSLRPAGRGLLEPAGERLGREAIATADVVLLPGVAVGLDGTRLGRGGGSYDRALARLSDGSFAAVLLYADEVVVGVPSEAHDRRVHAAVTPDRVTRF